MMPIPEFDPDNLKFVTYDAQKHVLPNLNFAQSNGDDPLDVQNYYDNIMTGKYHPSGLTYVLKYEKTCIGFFVVGLTTIRQEHNPGIPRLEGKDTNDFTKGLLIDKIGIDQNYRCFRIGKYILQFCIGLVKSINTSSQIRVIIFETTNSLAEKIYHPKYRFNYVKKNENIVWAYKTIC